MIRIGSRGSALARWQAEHIAARLRAGGVEVSIEILTTTGDRMQAASFAQVGTKGMFTKEIEEALLASAIDLAVHSLKDLPTELPEGFALAAIPERADARDAFVSVNYSSIAALPQGAVVGTSSLRRQAQMRALRPDLDLRELRGNVDTRLRKLEDGKYDAVVLASAGLDRLEQTDWLRGRLSAEEMCPAAGQGALAVECRAGDKETRALVARLEHPATRFAVTLERAALGAMGGGCHVPVGVHCEPVGKGGWRVTGVVAAPDGTRLVRETMSVDASESDMTAALEHGRRLAALLLMRGAGEILAEVEAAQRQAQSQVQSQVQGQVQSQVQSEAKATPQV